MNWQCSGRIGGRSSSYKPRVEALEDRDLLAANFIVQGSTLIVTGPTSKRTNPNVQVIINDNGTDQANNITAFSQSFFIPNVPITSVVVALKAGNDHVSYNLTGTLLQTRGVSVSLGAGNDRFDGFFRQNLANGADMTLQVFGGGGDDVLNSVVVSQVNSGSDFNTFLNGGAGDDRIAVQTSTFAGIAAGATYNTFLTGGGGNNALSDDYQGALNGNMQLSEVAGNSGNNAASANVIILPGSTGRFLPSTITGGPGNDLLRFVIRNFSSAVSINSIITAGGGFDSCIRTPNVAAFGCDRERIV